MTNVHRQPIRHWIVAVLIGALALPVLSAVAPITADAKGRCTQKVRGAHAESYTVASGQKLCVTDANVTGDINVASGGKLKIVRSKVTGAINLASGFVKFKMCKSKQFGGSAVSVTGGVKPVLMGGTPTCAGNRFSGVVNLTSNQALVKMGKNEVGGAVNAASNQGGISMGKNEIVGATTITDNLVQTLLKGNTITGALNCSGNAPAPTNGGSPNDVEGARSDQCLGNF